MFVLAVATREFMQPAHRRGIQSESSDFEK
jgi:hypothetical protein